MRASLPASRTSLTSVQARLSGAGAEIILVPGHHVAGRVADAAADAFDAGIGRAARGRRRRHDVEIGRGFARNRSALGVAPLVEERRHSTARSFTTVKLRSGSSRSLPSVGHLADAGAAGPARAAVHHHGAGAAHADAAGEAVGQRRVLLALNLGDHVEDGLVRAPRHAKVWKAALGRAAPDVHRQCQFGSFRHDRMLGHSHHFEHRTGHARPRQQHPRFPEPPFRRNANGR